MACSFSESLFKNRACWLRLIMKRKVGLESYLYRNVNYGNGSLKGLVVCECVCVFKQYLRHYGKLYFVLGLFWRLRKYRNQGYSSIKDLQ